MNTHLTDNRLIDIVMNRFCVAIDHYKGVASCADDEREFSYAIQRAREYQSGVSSINVLIDTCGTQFLNKKAAENTILGLFNFLKDLDREQSPLLVWYVMDGIAQIRVAPCLAGDAEDAADLSSTASLH